MLLREMIDLESDHLNLNSVILWLFSFAAISLPLTLKIRLWKVKELNWGTSEVPSR